jgi:hypothetical protein
VAVVLVALLILGGVRMSRWMGNFDDAIDTRAMLEQDYPTLESYQPRLDGRIAAERLAVFLRVREALLPACSELSDVVASLDGAVGEMNALEEKEGEPGIKDVPWLAIGRTVGSAFSLPPAIGRFAKARNEALLQEKMGFGEYAWIFSAAYSHTTPEEGVLQRGEVEFDDPSERVRSNVIGMMRRALASIEAQESPPQESQAFAEALREELAALDADPARTLWAEGLPGPLAASIEPCAAEIEALSCPAIREFELARHRKKSGMSITVD